MNFQPGDAVAAESSPYRPDMLVIGRVQADGQSVIWYDMVNADGHGAKDHSPGLGMGRKAVPLKGYERPCPPAFLPLLPPR